MATSGYPRGPGLRVTLDEVVLEEHPRAHVYFNLYAENWRRRQAQRPVPTEQV